MDKWIKKLHLSSDEAEMFIHDINNLRGDEWIEVVRDVCPTETASFKRFIRSKE